MKCSKIVKVLVLYGWAMFFCQTSQRNLNEFDEVQCPYTLFATHLFTTCLLGAIHNKSAFNKEVFCKNHTREFAKEARKKCRRMEA